MAAEKQHINLLVVPAQKPSSSLYSNTTFTYAHSPTDVTIVFMQAPLLSDEDLNALAQQAKDGQATVHGSVVASITLPRGLAVGLAKKLIELVGEEPQP